MTIIRWVCALALALMPVCATAQVASSVKAQSPAGYLPAGANFCSNDSGVTWVPCPTSSGGGGGGGAVTQSGTWSVNLGTIGGAATAAKQDAIQTVLDAMNTRIGNTTSPAPGSMNWYLAAIKTAAENTDPVLIAPRTSATDARTSVAASATPVLLLSPNPARTGCVVNNESAASLRVGLSSAVSMTSYDYPVPAMTTDPGSFECPPGWVGPVYGIWSSATGNALIGERAP